MVSNFIFIARRRWPILVFIPLLSVVAVLALTSGTKKVPVRYTTTLYLAADPEVVNLISLQQAAVDLRQTDVAQDAADALGKTDVDPEQFSKKLKLKVEDESLTIRMSATDADREFVRDFLEVYAASFIAANQNELNESYVAQLEQLEKSRDSAQLDLATFTSQNRELLNAVPPDPSAVVQQRLYQDRASVAEQRVLDLKDSIVESPYRISRTDPVSQVVPAKLQLPQSRALRASLAFFLAMVGAVVLVALIEKLNPRVDDPRDAERIIEGPVLAMVPIMKGSKRKILERADLSTFSGPFAESFRAMRSHLDYRSNAEGLERPPCVMIVSSAPGEGKTTSAAFLSLSYAEVGRDVVVVGGDFRRPAIHRLFGVPRAPGLSSRLLSNDSSSAPEDVVRSIVKRDDRTGVRIIPSGPGTDRVTGLLGDLAAVTSAGLDSGCTVVIDTAPVMVANDAIDFLPLVDWVIVVVRLGHTTERSLRQTVASLNLNNARIAGCIMVGSLESGDAKRYYYSYYKVDDERDEMLDRHIAMNKSAADRPAPAPGPEAPDTPDGPSAPVDSSIAEDPVVPSER